MTKDKNSEIDADNHGVHDKGHHGKKPHKDSSKKKDDDKKEDKDKDNN